MVKYNLIVCLNLADFFQIYLFISRHVAEQCLSNNDKSSPQCQNAHAVVQSTLDADCDCAHLFPEMVPSQKSAASMSVQKSDGGGDLFAAQISNNKCASNLHFSKNGQIKRF